MWKSIKMNVWLLVVTSILVVSVLTMRYRIIAAASVAQGSAKTVAFVPKKSILRNTMKSLTALNRQQEIMPQHRTIAGTSIIRQINLPLTKSRLMSTVSGNGRAPDILHINREQMEEIVEDYESGGRDESQYCIIDVRTEEEVRSTGKISDNVYTLPVQVIMQSKVFDMDPDEFEEFCKFPKPTYDETIVFTCAAGMRSVSACHFAAQSGYTKLINYTGGANEWFSSPRF